MSTQVVQPGHEYIENHVLSKNVFVLVLTQSVLIVM